MRSISRCAFIVAFFLSSLGTSDPIRAAEPIAENWPQWRGTSGVGVSREAGIASRWSTSENVTWRWTDPGFGHSSPIVWNDALFLTSNVDESRMLFRLDAKTGAEVWRREVVRSSLEKKHRKNSHASSTPATDGELVYVTFFDRPNVVIAAYDFRGDLQWRKVPGEFHSMHGFCGTPVLFEDLVIVNCDQDHEKAFIVALSRKNGDERWRIERENKVRSYCPPTFFEIDGTPQMILAGSKTVCSYDPRTGERNWFCWGPTEQCVASVVYDGSRHVFVTGGYPDREFLAIDPRGKGDVTETHIKWRRRNYVSYVPSPLYLEGHFYCVSDTGILSVLDAESGEYKNKIRLDGDYSASLLYASGHIYCASEDGLVTVVRASPELEVTAKIDMADPIYASPAVSRGTLYLRTWKHLYAIGGSSPPQPGE